jgi:RNA polymerase sigma factor (sigma-70 family)
MSQIMIGTPRKQRSVSLISREEEITLCRRAKAGDQAAKQRLIELNMKMISRLASHFKCRGNLSHEDLVQEGIVGFLYALGKFDLKRGCRLSTYAFRWIKRSMIKAVAETGQPIAIQVNRYAKIAVQGKVEARLWHELGRAPTEAELAQEIGCGLKAIRRINGIPRGTQSLERPVGPCEKTMLLEFVSDTTAISPDASTLKQQQRKELDKALAALPATLGRESITARNIALTKERFGFYSNNCEEVPVQELSLRYGLPERTVQHALNMTRKSLAKNAPHLAELSS